MDLANKIEQMARYATIRPEWGDRMQDILAKHGVLPGYHAGPKIFIKAYGEQLEKAKEDYMQKSKNAKEMVLMDPVTKQEHDCGITAFIDDIGDKAIATGVKQLTEEAKLEFHSKKEALDQVGSP